MANFLCNGGIELVLGSAALIYYVVRNVINEKHGRVQNVLK